MDIPPQKMEDPDRVQLIEANHKRGICNCLKVLVTTSTCKTITICILSTILLSILVTLITLLLIYNMQVCPYMYVPLRWISNYEPKCTNYSFVLSMNVLLLSLYICLILVVIVLIIFIIVTFIILCIIILSGCYIFCLQLRQDIGIVGRSMQEIHI